MAKILQRGRNLLDLHAFQGECVVRVPVERPGFDRQIQLGRGAVQRDGVIARFADFQHSGHRQVVFAVDRFAKAAFCRKILFYSFDGLFVFDIVESISIGDKIDLFGSRIDFDPDRFLFIAGIGELVAVVPIDQFLIRIVFVGQHISASIQLYGIYRGDPVRVEIIIADALDDDFAGGSGRKPDGNGPVFRISRPRFLMAAGQQDAAAGRKAEQRPFSRSRQTVFQIDVHVCSADFCPGGRTERYIDFAGQEFQVDFFSFSSLDIGLSGRDFHRSLDFGLSGRLSSDKQLDRAALFGFDHHRSRHLNAVIVAFVIRSPRCFYWGISRDSKITAAWV